MARNLVGHDGVNAVGQGGRPQRAAPPDALGHHGLDELVAASAIKSPGRPDHRPPHTPGRRPPARPAPSETGPGLSPPGVPLDELDRRPVGRDMGGVGLVVDQLAHLVMDLVGKAVVQIIRFNGDAHVHLPVGRLQQSLNVLLTGQ